MELTWVYRMVTGSAGLDDVIVFVRLLLLPVVRNTKYHAIPCEIGINAIPILLMGGMMNIYWKHFRTLPLGRHVRWFRKCVMYVCVCVW
jgi:hypothetical protein